MKKIILLKRGVALGRPFEGEKAQIGALAKDSKGNIWVHTKSENGVAIVQQGGTFQWQQAPFNRIPKAEIGAIYPESDGTIWIGGANGLVRVSADYQQEKNTTYASIVREVRTNEVTLFKGTFYNAETYPSLSQAGTLSPSIAFKNNDLRFNFTSPAYNAPDRLLFSHLLQGYESDWSVWNTETYKEFTNLPAGAYRFQVKSQKCVWLRK